MKLSIVSSLYRSSATVEEFARRALAAGEALFDQVELILVNDGSPDDSLDRALAVRARDPRVTVIDLSRNFGHHRALMTGLAHADGDYVFLIDSDLEEEPEVLATFHARLEAGDCDVVFGVQERRKGSLVERAMGALFFALASALTLPRLPRNLVIVRLMTRRYVQALVEHRDREFIIAQLFVSTGFVQVPVPVRKLSRSPTTYSLRRRSELAIKYLTANSTKLLYVILAAGLLLASASALAMVYLVGRYLVGGIGVSGWTSLIVSIWFFGGCTILILGIQGIYIANILVETKPRPYSVIRQIYGKAPGDRAVELHPVEGVLRSDQLGGRVHPLR